MNRRDAEAQRVNEITEKVIGICIEIHRQLGPGLLESAYESCLCIGLRNAGLAIRRQVEVPIEYEGEQIRPGFRIDLIVEDLVVVELKAVEKLLPVHEAQVLTYLKLTGLSAALLINFNVPLLKSGIRRLVNNLAEPFAPQRLRGSAVGNAGLPGESPSAGNATHADNHVKALIPHREPFLFVDRVLEQAPGRIVTERLVRGDEPHFAGHYPGSPLMPGVLLCEACFQSGAMLLGSATESANQSAGPRPAPAADSTSSAGKMPASQDANVLRASRPQADADSQSSAGRMPASQDASVLRASRPQTDADSQSSAGRMPASLAAKMPVLTRILEAKFRGMVRPGDLLRIEVAQDEVMGDAHIMSGRVDVAGKNVLRVKFIVAMVELPASEQP